MNKKVFLNVPSAYDLSAIKQASERPEFVRMLCLSYNGVAPDKIESQKPKSRKKSK